MENQASTFNLSQEDFDLMTTQTGISRETIKEIYEEFMTEYPNGIISKENFLKELPVKILVLSLKL